MLLEGGTSIHYEAIPAVAFVAQEGEEKCIPVAVEDHADGQSEDEYNI